MPIPEKPPPLPPLDGDEDVDEATVDSRRKKQQPSPSLTEHPTLAPARSPPSPDATAKRNLILLFGLTAVALWLGALSGQWLLHQLRTPSTILIDEGVPAPPRPSVPEKTEQQPAVAVDAGVDAGVQAPKKVQRPPAPPKVARIADTKPSASACPKGMVLIDAGPAIVGSNRSDPWRTDDEPAEHARQVAAYCMDVYEYPNQAGTLPTVGVDWLAAQQLCEARGKRLCSEAEWEKACKGSGRRFPYGRDYASDACNVSDERSSGHRLSPSGHFSKCKAATGVMDLSGNVSEWTISSASGGSPDKVAKGGSFAAGPESSRCASRRAVPPSAKLPDVGVRCCLSPGQ